MTVSSLNKGKAILIWRFLLVLSSQEEEKLKSRCIELLAAGYAIRDNFPRPGFEMICLVFETRSC